MALIASLPRMGPLRRVSRTLKAKLPPMNFITIHYLYFLSVCLFSACVFWGISTPRRSVSFTDSLFLVVSAMTLAGLNTVNLSTLNTVQQIMLFVLIMIGSSIFVSAFVVHVRKGCFERRLNAVVERERARISWPTSLNLRSSQTQSRSRSRGVVWEPNMPLQTGNGVLKEKDIPETDPRPTNVATNPLQKSQTLPNGRSSSEEVNALKHWQSAADVPSGGENTETTVPSSNEPQLTPMATVISDGNLMPALTYRSEGGDELHMLAPGPSNEAHVLPEHITFGPHVYFRRYPAGMTPVEKNHRLLAMQGVGASSSASIKPRRGSQSTLPDPESVPATRETRKRTFPSQEKVSRNSQFHDLTEEEREKLGGYEYRALRFLAWVVPVYFVLWQLFGCIGIGAYVAYNKPAVARMNGLNPWWVGSFNAVSAFNNSGMSLLDANMVAFQESVYMLITMGLLILAGNTCYPVFLRSIVWSLLKLAPDNESWTDFRKTLQFLLEHPRRCYTNLFPRQHTYWLLLSVIVLNGIDWAAFEILNLHNLAITTLPAGIEVLDGLFQALAVRSGGFYVVNIATLRISLQVLYVVMMYISVYPVTITIRNSNVYEERSLGIYSDDPGYAAISNTARKKTFFGKLRRTLTNQTFEQTKTYFVRQQLRAQLAHDLWWIVLAIFLIMIIEGPAFEADPAVYSVFNVVFEVVSAYGCVGISVGLPNQAYSFSGGWRKLSKLILCAVMLRGRHRGLPVAIDKAVLLPGEHLHEAEEEDAQIRLERTVSRGRVV